MTWILLGLLGWLAVGGTTGAIGARRVKKISDEAGVPDNDRCHGCLVGCMLLGPAAPLFAYACTRCTRTQAMEATRLLHGPLSNDRLEDCLQLREAIIKELAIGNRETGELAADVLQVKIWLNTQANPEQSAEPTVINRSGRALPTKIRDQPELEAACLRLQALDERRRQLLEALEATDNQIANIRFGYEAVLEAHEVTDEMLTAVVNLLPATSEPETVRTAEDEGTAAASRATTGSQGRETAAERQAMLAKLGRPSDECLRQIATKVSERIVMNHNGQGVGSVPSLALNGLPSLTERRFLELRGTISAWLSTAHNDLSLGLAVSQCATRDEAISLIRFRLEQAAEAMAPAVTAAPPTA